ncbi:MAG: polyprenyl synthetase family protein [Alphaproteobacteria bacterium]|nr:polyprenyl synthetase family protein [Alphaproteobacteria bacterium]
MPFLDELTNTAEQIDALLDRLMPLDTAPAKRVIDAMRYASIGQGKRLRPFLVCESAKLFDVEDTHALRTGAALECIHCYSLVHDDLPAMDNDELRRGKPTTHIAFDEAAAILAGDGLLTFAFEILAHPDTHPDPVVRSKLVSELAIASGPAGMVGGQMLDLEAEARESHDLDEIITLQGMKTGALFRFACESGALLAQAGDAERSALSVYADRVGLAFQIADDILDQESTPEQLGKQTQKDAEAGKATFIDLLGLDGAKKRAHALVDEACASLDAFGNRAGILREAALFIVERKN